MIRRCRFGAVLFSERASDRQVREGASPLLALWANSAPGYFLTQRRAGAGGSDAAKVAFLIRVVGVDPAPDVTGIVGKGTGWASVLNSFI